VKKVRLGAIAALIAGLAVLMTGMTGNAATKDSDCRFANFNASDATGVVEVCGVHPGTIGTVTAVVRTDRPGWVLLCDENSAGENCAGVVAGQISAGCVSVSFQIELSPEANEPMFIGIADPVGALNNFATATLETKVSHRDLKQTVKSCGD
jgi:hypothetical protein